MGHEATRRAGQQRGSAMGAHYRHTTAEMAARIATAIEQRSGRFWRSLSRPEGPREPFSTASVLAATYRVSWQISGK